MMYRTWMVALALVAGLCLLARVPAADPPKADAARTAQAMIDIGLAFQAADLGRQAGSPEMLIGAAKLLNNVSLVGLRQAESVEPVVGKGKEPPKSGTLVDETKTKPADFSKDVEDLLKEARALANNDKNILAQVDGIKVNKLSPDTGKGSVNGPWQSPRKVLEGETENGNDWNAYTFNFKGGEQAYVKVTADQPVDVTVQRSSNKGTVVEAAIVKEATGRVCELSWTPAMTREFQVTVTSKKKTGYTLYKN